MIGWLGWRRPIATFKKDKSEEEAEAGELPSATTPPSVLRQPAPAARASPLAPPGSSCRPRGRGRYLPAASCRQPTAARHRAQTSQLRQGHAAQAGQQAQQVGSVTAANKATSDGPVQRCRRLAAPVSKDGASGTEPSKLKAPRIGEQISRAH